MNYHLKSNLLQSVSITFIITLILVIYLLSACQSLSAPKTPTTIPLAKELIFYDWAEDMPQSILDSFTAEYGVEVTYVSYETQEEALANAKAGIVYDVIVVDNDFVQLFLADNLLAEIDYRNIPNIKNISANFLDLAYDPKNKHTIPFNWGTTGLVVRSDLVEEPITHWRDLWDPRYAGKIGIRAGSREPLSIALKSLGYSINSENPTELQAARDHLFKLNGNIVFVESYAGAAVPLLASGEVIILVGWAQDVLVGRKENAAITYVLPEEGAFLWGDNFVIPANSPHKYTAEVFLNFILRPEINAQIVNQNYYASANKAAQPFINPEIINDPVIFPSNNSLTNAEVFLPLSLEGEQKYREIFEEFQAANK